MPYATLADLQTRYGADEIAESSDHDHIGDINLIVTSAALTDASLEIDAYLSTSYTLPLIAPYPSLLTNICCELARWAIYKDKAPETVRLRREDAIALLRRIASGDARLQVSIDTPATDKTGNTFTVQTSARVFTDATLARMPNMGTLWN